MDGWIGGGNRSSFVVSLSMSTDIEFSHSLRAANTQESLTFTLTPTQKQ